MRVELLYGEGTLGIEVPDGRSLVVTPRHATAVPDPAAAVRAALRSPVSGLPLVERCRRARRVAVAICDGTRPQPRRVVLPVVLDELAQVVDLADVVVLVATGTHRPNTTEELETMLGSETLSRVAVVNHDARDASSLVRLGVLGDGVPVTLNARFMAADVRITTGFVEPHFFAGFSGGPKLVAPGLAGLETTLVLHDARRIASPLATWGVTTGNPVHDDIRAIATAAGVHFACDVVLDRHQQIVAAYGGDLFEMHAAACDAVRTASMVELDHAFDVVVTSNAGFPLDQNLYQCVKGMSAAARAVRDGGRIVVAAACRDGFPDHGGYRSLLEGGATPRQLLEQIAGRPAALPDQWQVQVQAQVLRRARVGLHCEGLSDGEVRAAHLDPVGDVSTFVAEELERLGPGATCCVLPEGPSTVTWVGHDPSPGPA